jgi:hypothetical protein
MGKADLLRFITQDDVAVEEMPWGVHDWISKVGLTDAEHLMLVPMNMVHGTYNAGAEDLVFLAILSPAKFEGPALVDVSGEAAWVGKRQGNGETAK